MKNKNYKGKAPSAFSLYGADWYDSFLNFSDEIAGSLIKAVYRYVCDGDTREIGNEVATAIFTTMRNSIDRNLEKYEAKKEQRIEAAKKSVEARKATTVNDRSTSVQRKATTVQRSSTVSVSDSVSVSDKEDKSSLEYMGDKSKRFTPPSLDEVQNYVSEKGFKIEASTFIDFYSSKGWMVGKNKMKDWKAAVRTWNRNDRQQKPEEVGITLKDNSTNKYDNDKLW